MKNLFYLTIFLLLSFNCVSQDFINSPYWKLEKSFNFPDKSKNQLFILAKKFVDYGWQPSKDSHYVSIDEFETENSPKTENTSKNEYDLNKVIQFENKEQGIINCHILSPFQSRFHGEGISGSFRYEYNVKLSVNNKGGVTIELSDFKSDEFVSNEVKRSGLYRMKVQYMEKVLYAIPEKLNEFILKN